MVSRKVVVKVLRVGTRANDERNKKRFKKEIEALLGINHHQRRGSIRCPFSTSNELLPALTVSFNGSGWVNPRAEVNRMTRV